MRRPLNSESRHRAIRGLWVAWNPDMAPQAMVRNRQGNNGFFAANDVAPSNEAGVLRFIASAPLHSSGMAGIFMNRHTIKATAMNSRAKAKMG